jgi:hypothetical protein
MPGGSGTRLQVSLASRASYSACIVARQLGSDSASRTERGRGDLGTAWRLRRSTGCAMPALPRVRIECALVTGGMATGRVLAIWPVPLATTWARALGAAEPTVLVGTMGMALLAAVCVGCTRAAAPVDVDGGVKVAPWAVVLDPGDRGPAPGLGGTGAASGTGCVTEGFAVPACIKRAPGTKAVGS